MGSCGGAADGGLFRHPEVGLTNRWAADGVQNSMMRLRGQGRRRRRKGRGSACDGGGGVFSTNQQRRARGISCLALGKRRGLKRRVRDFRCSSLPRGSCCPSLSASFFRDFSPGAPLQLPTQLCFPLRILESSASSRSSLQTEPAFLFPAIPSNGSPQCVDGAYDTCPATPSTDA